MEIQHNPLMIVTEEEIKKVRKAQDIDEKTLKQSIDHVDEWIKKEPHLAEAAKYLNNNLIERVLLLAKGSVEATKHRIERLLTSRGMMPELCLNRSIEEFSKLWDVINYVPLPRLCPTDQSRVNVTQFLSENLEEFTILSYFRYAFMIGEYRLNYDYTPSERYIIDMKNIHVGLLSKINPIVVKKAEVLCVEGFGTKIKGIHILNAPYFVDKVVFLLKQALREKVASRLHVHSDYADLHKHIPKEILPEEYGGDEQSCEKLSAQWKEQLSTEEARKAIKEADKLVSDESKRSKAKFNEEYMGMPGSFRRLTVD